MNCNSILKSSVHTQILPHRTVKKMPGLMHTRHSVQQSSSGKQPFLFSTVHAGSERVKGEAQLTVASGDISASDVCRDTHRRLLPPSLQSTAWYSCLSSSARTVRLPPRGLFRQEGQGAPPPLASCRPPPAFLIFLLRPLLLVRLPCPAPENQPQDQDTSGLSVSPPSSPLQVLHL